MPTPTTPQVLAAERVPPMFRPNNQANLVPATPLNPAASMSFMPGLGKVRSGNEVGNSDLDPVGSEELMQWRAQQSRGKTKTRMKAEAALAALNRQKVAFQTRLDGAKARGIPLPRQEVSKIRREIAHIDARIATIHRSLKRQQGGGNTLPPWFRRPVKAPQGRNFRPLMPVNAPVTPDPLRLASPGANMQTDQDTLRQMQASVQPVQRRSVLPQAAALAPARTTGQRQLQLRNHRQRMFIPPEQQLAWTLGQRATIREAMRQYSRLRRRDLLRQMRNNLRTVNREIGALRRKIGFFKSLKVRPQPVHSIMPVPASVPSKALPVKTAQGTAPPVKRFNPFYPNIIKLIQATGR